MGTCESVTSKNIVSSIKQGSDGNESNACLTCPRASISAQFSDQNLKPRREFRITSNLNTDPRSIGTATSSSKVLPAPARKETKILRDRDEFNSRRASSNNSTILGTETASRSPVSNQPLASLRIKISTSSSRADGQREGEDTVLKLALKTDFRNQRPSTASFRVFRNSPHPNTPSPRNGETPSNTSSTISPLQSQGLGEKVAEPRKKLKTKSIPLKIPLHIVQRSKLNSNELPVQAFAEIAELAITKATERAPPSIKPKPTNLCKGVDFSFAAEPDSPRFNLNDTLNGLRSRPTRILQEAHNTPRNTAQGPYCATPHLDHNNGTKFTFNNMDLISILPSPASAS